MRIPEIKTAVADCFELDQPVCVSGAPGIGKSDAFAQVAAERGAIFVDIRLSMFDPVDLRGIPFLNSDGGTQWARPAIWPADGTRETVLLFDEMDRAAPAVLNAALQIVLNRRIGEHALPASVRIGAAMNGATDRGTNKLPSALANRFLHLAAEYDPAATREHFRAIGLSPVVEAFLHMRPELGWQAAPKGENAFATPRQWERVARTMHLPDARRRPLIAGLVGAAVAAEFEAFIELFRELPPISEIVANPHGAAVPRADQPSLHYAVSTALARKADAANFAAVQTYLARLPKEFATMATIAAVKRDSGLTATRAFIDWAAANPDAAGGRI